MMADPAVRVASVSKRFRLGQTHDSLSDLLASGVRRLFGGSLRRSGSSTFWALRDLSFTVGSGEAIGLIGPNGAGKSTALRLLARILRPDRGAVEVDGRLAALIEVGAGFHGDLTGRENVYLNGAILGMTRQEIRRKLDAIVSFAGIERFLDMPVKRYSSGMYARLGFSIAAHVDPQVLLVDEVLSVGDALFRVRCLERMHELVRQGTTLVFVTHQLDQMQSICRRALVLEEGRLTFEGTGQEAVGHYLKVMSRAYVHRPPDLASGQDRQSEAVEVTALRFYDESGDEVIWVRPRDTVRAELAFRLHRPIRRLIVELSMRATLTDNLLCVNSGRDGITFDAAAGTHTLTLRLPGLRLAGGQYFWNVRMWDADTGAAELDTPFRYPLAIDDGGCKTGVVCVEHDWALATNTTGDASEREASTPTSVELVRRTADRGPVEAVRTQGACREHLPLR
jgi:ABC-type polysaccharide/polyol phosphate transport system ATPase subunit